MESSQIHHITLNVSDLSQAKIFYSHFFGLSEIKRPDDRENGGVWLEFSDGRQLHLRKGRVPENYGQHFAFLVDNLDQIRDELISAGIDVSSAIEVGAARQAFLDDPSGNRLEIHQIRNS